VLLHRRMRAPLGIESQMTELLGRVGSGRGIKTFEDSQAPAAN
jgi:hypothetical protein